MAITKLAPSIEDEAKALAAAMSLVPYEVRLKLNAGFPAIVATVADENRAVQLVTGIRARGSQARWLDSTHVVAAADMIGLRRARFEPDALVDEKSRIAWSDLAVLVRATHRWSSETKSEVTKSKLAIGRAVLTGGLATHRKTTEAVVQRVDHIDQVLYMFPRSAGTPWILRERDARYDALGTELSTSSTHNFVRMVDALRTRARGAAYDDRLVARRGTPAEVDLFAHLIAGSVDAGAAPFR